MKAWQSLMHIVRRHPSFTPHPMCRRCQDRRDREYRAYLRENRSDPLQNA
ncbi:MAG TPA: hypothetical protein VLA82_06420 [Actinomycetota bacterium]|nr:hypothetical protein [Actinomycetota bacterium]